MATEANPNRMRIESAIRREYWETGRTDFWLSNFVEKGLGTDEEVRQVVARLVSERHLEAQLELRCAAGHTLWTGRAEGAPKHLPECMECAHPGDFADGGEFLTLRVTPEWRQMLDDERPSAEKKSPRIH
jgi:hypothetical protein